MTSDTPRTDAHKKAMYSEDFDVELAKTYALARTLERELNTLRWIPLTERLPTIDDGNEFEDVEWSDGKSIREGNYKHSKGETHWRRNTLP